MNKKEKKSIQSVTLCDLQTFDSDTKRLRDAFGNLIVKDCNISKSCVSPYLGSELQGKTDGYLDPNKIYKILRSDSALSDAVSTFKSAPITLGHPDIGLDLPDTPAERIGMTGGDCKFESPYLKTTLVFNVESAIDDIESKRKKELSLGYICDIDMISGEYQGDKYDGVMKNIVVNHVALVKRGRAGSDVAVCDKNLGANMPDKDEMLAKIREILTGSDASDADAMAKKILELLVSHEESELETEPENESTTDDDEVEKEPTPAPAEVKKSEESVGDEKMIMISDKQLKSIISSALAKDRLDIERLAKAKEQVKPLVGNVTGDSAEAVYRQALKLKGVKNSESMNAASLESVVMILADANKKTATVRDSASDLYSGKYEFDFGDKK